MLHQELCALHGRLEPLDLTGIVTCFRLGAFDVDQRVVHLDPRIDNSLFKGDFSLFFLSLGYPEIRLQRPALENRLQ